ncbi:hypothetical protein [Aeromonas rivipollensis]|uniref:hypothetical protein n=1 Tax=Aeromonas rivipollensis TaxID=948519 RepID=UPI0030CB564F
MLTDVYKKLVKERTVPVDFVSYPGNPVDTTLFNQVKYTEIDTDGFKVSPLKIMHSATVHYQGRYPNSVSLRFINSFIEMIASIENYNSDGLLYFNNNENGEFQTRSSEVISVGLCIALSSKLFDVNKNRFRLIEGGGKRCDFYMVKDGLDYLLEAKGRKGSISSAVRDVFTKKANYNAISPKYGIISKIPRGESPTSIEVIDPEFIPQEVPRKELIRLLLMHYSKVADVAGFWRLSELLLERSQAIFNGVEISLIENKQLDYDNVLKLGRSLEVYNNDISCKVFFPRGNNSGFRKEFDGYVSLYPMEERLIEILNSQNYEELISYNYKEQILNDSDDTFMSVSNSGSILLLTPIEKLYEISR